MAISTYTELQTAIADWLNRTDLEAVIPNFISLSEASFNRTLRLSSQIKLTTLTVTDSATPLPVDLLEIESISPALDYRSPELFLRDEPGTYTLIGGEMRVCVTVPVEQIKLVYYARVPSLSNTQTTNAVLTAHPDLYLYTSLAQSAPYLKEDARLAVWGQMAGQILEAVRIDDENRRFGGTTVQMVSTSTFG
jgi:hypothetical protein